MNQDLTKMQTNTWKGANKSWVSWQNLKYTMLAIPRNAPIKKAVKTPKKNENRENDQNILTYIIF